MGPALGRTSGDGAAGRANPRREGDLLLSDGVAAACRLAKVSFAPGSSGSCAVLASASEGCAVTVVLAAGWRPATPVGAKSDSVVSPEGGYAAVRTRARSSAH